MKLKRFNDINEKVDYDYEKLDDKIKEIIDYVNDELIDEILSHYTKKPKGKYKFPVTEMSISGAKKAMKELKNKIINKLK